MAPGTRREIGAINAGIAAVLGFATGGGRPPNLFTTLARNRGLFRPWLRFAGKLMPGGRLPRADSELLILRVAARCDCEYEWRHHERLGRAAGLSAEQIEGARAAEIASLFSARQAALLRAADELHDTRDLSDDAFAALQPLLSDAELIELFLLIGHYEMLAMTINALRIEPDAPGRPSRAARALQRAVERRR